MHDYGNMESVDAIRLAKDMSGLTVDEAAEAADISADTMRRYLRRDSQRYDPGLSKIPNLCKAFGNTVLLRWIEAKLEREPEDVPPARTRAEVLTAVSRIAASLGDAQRVLADSENAGIDPALAREIRGLLREVIEDSRFAMAKLAALARLSGRTEAAIFSRRRPGRLEHWWRKAVRMFRVGGD